MKIILLFILTFSSFCGSAGVKNGTIRGAVRDGSNNMLQGVYVIAQFQGSPAFQRSTMTGSDGTYTLNNMPIGPYTMGFSKSSYQSISAGSSGGEKSAGSIDAYIESGATFTVSTISLKFLGESGLATVLLKMIDSYTGETVRNSQVVLGSTSSTNTSEGLHQTTISVTPTKEGLPDIPLIITNPGYEDVEESIQAIPGQVNEFTVELTPHLSTLQGRIELNSFPFPKLLSQARVTIDNIDIEKINAKLDDSGFFQISVPASTDKNKRSFNVRVHLQGFQDIVIPNIISPIAGATTIQTPIKLTPITIMVRGNVTSSSGIASKVSAMNQAYIKELGISATIQNNIFTFAQVPTLIPLTVKVIQLNLNNEVETGEVKFTASRNGTTHFVIPAIVSTSISK